MGKKKLNNVASIDFKGLEIEENEENEENEVEELTYIADGDAEEGNIAEGNIAEGNIAEGNIAEGNIAEGNIAEGNIAEGNIEQEVNLYIEEIVEDGGKGEELNIPKNIFLTHKSIAFINSNPNLIKSFNSWVQNKNQYKIHFFTDEMCNQFMKTHFSGKTYQAYCRLPMAVMKADLWRYCVLYTYGGIYSDADAECLVNPNIFTSAKSLLVCAPESDNIHLCQWCFAAPKNSPILKYIIDLSVKRILEIPEIKGEHIIHYLTGPACFTAGIELYLKDNNHIIYGNKLDYQKYRNNIMCVFNNTFFHKKIIYHHFAGSDKNGWKQERYNKLM